VSDHGSGCRSSARLTRLRAEARGAVAERGPNALALAARRSATVAVMQPSREIVIPVGKSGDGVSAPANAWLLARIADAAHDALGDDLPAETCETLTRIGGYADECC